MLLTWMEVAPVLSFKIRFSLIIHQITGKSPAGSIPLWEHLLRLATGVLRGWKDLMKS